MSKEERRVPELRFKGFHDDWEQRKLNDIYEIKMGHSPKSENYTSNPYDYILVQGNADLINGWVSPRVWTTQVTSFVKAGSILISVRAPVGNVGKTTYDVVIGRGIAAVKGDEFFFQLLTKMHLNGYWKKFSTGSTFESINSKDIKEALIVTPTKEERNIIGLFLEKIDDMVTLHQRKINILLKLKENFMLYLFPGKEKLFPELRFSGFHTAWEQRKFFDNIKTIIDFRGKTPKKLNMTWSSTGYLALSALNVKNGYIDKTIQAKYGTEELYKKWMGEKHLLKGFVLFTTEAPMGNVAIVPDDDGYILSQRTIALNTYETKMTNLFLATILRSNNVQNKLISLSSGATAKGVSQKSLSALKLVIPIDLEEQKKISLLISDIDENINSFEKKLEILLKLKQVYLRKIFI